MLLGEDYWEVRFLEADGFWVLRRLEVAGVQILKGAKIVTMLFLIEYSEEFPVENCVISLVTRENLDQSLHQTPNSSQNNGNSW